VTQSERNRNLSKSLPKRFGFFDLAIESLGSQEGERLIDLVLGFRRVKSALQHVFMAVQQQFLFQTHPKRAYACLHIAASRVALGSNRIKSALRRGGLL
jgi:hypothetical protein